MEYLDNETSFLDEIKNIFHSLKGYDLVKNIKNDKNSRHKLYLIHWNKFELVY